MFRGLDFVRERRELYRKVVKNRVLGHARTVPEALAFLRDRYPATRGAHKWKREAEYEVECEIRRWGLDRGESSLPPPEPIPYNATEPSDFYPTPMRPPERGPDFPP